jgi:hypothetical protein
MNHYTSEACDLVKTFKTIPVYTREITTPDGFDDSGPQIFNYELLVVHENNKPPSGYKFSVFRRVNNILEDYNDKYTLVRVYYANSLDG